jgi:hypothetical protein
MNPYERDKSHKHRLSVITVGSDLPGGNFSNRAEAMTVIQSFTGNPGPQTEELKNKVVNDLRALGFGVRCCLPRMGWNMVSLMIESSRCVTADSRGHIDSCIRAIHKNRSQKKPPVPRQNLFLTRAHVLVSHPLKGFIALGCETHDLSR